MNNVYQILVEILINPILSKNTNGDLSEFDSTFWDEFALDFINYETNAEPVYLKLYKLSLNNPEQVFDKLDKVYELFIKQLAELYIKGQKDEAIIKLVNSKNTIFSNEVTFLNTLQNVIRKSERANLKKKMPFIVKNLEFQLDDEILKNAAKSAARSALKEKFKQWDKELEKEENVVNKPDLKYQLSSVEVDEDRDGNIPENSIGSKWITWGKFAMAACILIGITFTVKLIIDSDSQIPNNVYVSKTKPNIKQIDNFETELVIPDAEENTIFRKYLNDSQGFIGTDRNQKILIVDFYNRIKALNSSLKLSTKKGNTDKIISEIDSLNRLGNTYLLKNNGLKINVINKTKDLKLINLSNSGPYLRYLRMGTNYYKLIESDNFKPLLVEKDKAIIKQLDKIIITNPN